MSSSDKGRTKGTFTFTREQAAVLIAIYEKYPNLYNVHSEGYKNRNKRFLCIKTMVNEFNEHFPLAGVNIEDVKKKINSLRTQFFAEQNKVKKSMVSGAGADDIYTPSLWCYDQLMFLSENYAIKREQSNIEFREVINTVENDEPHMVFESTLEEFDENEVIGVMSPESRPSTSYSNVSEVPEQSTKKRKAKQEDAKAVELLERATTILDSATHRTPQINNLEAFGIMVAAELKEVKSSVRCRQLKRKILNIIHDALDEEANE